MFRASSNLKTNITRPHSFSSSVSYVFCNRQEWRTTDRRTLTRYQISSCNLNRQNAPLLNWYFTFHFWCLLHISKPRVHLQGDGFMYSYCVVGFTCNTSSWRWHVNRLQHSSHVCTVHQYYQNTSYYSNWRTQLQNHRNAKKVKIPTVTPTCFGSRRNYRQGAIPVVRACGTHWVPHARTRGWYAAITLTSSITTGTIEP
jgi:hypothetical protein